MPRRDRTDSVTKFFSIILLALSSYACEIAPDVIIDSPVPASVLGDPTDFHFTYLEEMPPYPYVELNDIDVTAYFNFDNENLTANSSDPDLKALVQVGVNTLEVRGLYTVARGNFTIDEVPPVIHLTGLDDTGPLSISGYFQDAASGGLLDVDGTDVPVASDNTFAGTVADLPFMNFSAQDPFGNGTSVTYARPDTYLPSMMGVQMNNSALVGVGTGIDAFMESIDVVILNQMGLVGMQIYGETMAVDFGNLTVDIYLYDMSMGTVDFTLAADAVENDLDLNASADDFSLTIYMELTGDWGFFLPMSGTLTSSTLTFSGDAVPSLNAGFITTALTNPVSSFSNDFGITVASMPAWLEPVFSDIELGLQSGLANTIMSTFVPQVLSGMLTSISQLQLNVDLEGSGSTLVVDTTTEDISVVGGALTLETGGNFSAPVAPGITETLGARYTPSVLPSLGALTPNGLAYDVGVAVSENMLNQIMLGAYHAGVMNFEFSSLVPNLPGVKARVRVYPASPPKIEMLGTVEALAQAVMQDLQIDVELSPALTEDYEPLFSGVINITTPYNLAPAVGGGVDIVIAPGLEVEVVKTTLDVSQVFGGPLILESIIELLIPQAIGGSLQNIAVIPMPSIDGFDLPIIEFWSSDDKEHLIMGGNLVTQ